MCSLSMYLPLGSTMLNIYFLSFLYFFLLALFTHSICIKILYFNSQTKDKLNVIGSILFFIFNINFWFFMMNKILGAKGVFLYFVVSFMFAVGFLHLVEIGLKSPWFPENKKFKSYLFIFLKFIGVLFLFTLNLRILL